MRSHELNDYQFKKIEHLLPGHKDHVGVTAKDNRMFINGVLWIFKTGAPWRDFPNDLAIGKMYIVDFHDGLHRAL